MPNVDDHFPFDRTMSELERKRVGFPQALRGYEDRQLAQFAFTGWLASNPETARKYEPENPQHWNG